jgi:hypothetical protein
MISKIIRQTIIYALMLLLFTEIAVENITFQHKTAVCGDKSYFCMTLLMDLAPLPAGLSIMIY